MEYATDPIQHFFQLDLDQFLTVRRSLAKTTAVSSGSACTSASLEPCAAKWKLERGKKTPNREETSGKNRLQRTTNSKHTYTSKTRNLFGQVAKLTIDQLGGKVIRTSCDWCLWRPCAYVGAFVAFTWSCRHRDRRDLEIASLLQPKLRSLRFGIGRFTTEAEVAKNSTW